ncbi:hypothetical protein Tco_0015287 [Tanacetum coccineum]
MSHKETKEEESKTDSEPAVRLTGSMVESYKKKHMRCLIVGSDFDEEFDANMDEAIEQVYDANKDTVEEGEVQVPTVDMEVNTASAPVTTARDGNGSASGVGFSVPKSKQSSVISEVGGARHQLYLCSKKKLLDWIFWSH